MYDARIHVRSCVKHALTLPELKRYTSGVKPDMQKVHWKLKGCAEVRGGAPEMAVHTVCAA